MKCFKHGLIATSLMLGLSLTGFADGTLPFEDGTLPFGDGTLPFDMIGNAVELKDGVEISKDLLKIKFASPLNAEQPDVPVDPADEAQPFVSALSSLGTATRESNEEATRCRVGLDFYPAFGFIETSNYGSFRITGVCADQYVLGQRQVIASSTSVGSLIMDGELSSDASGAQIFAGNATITRGTLSRSFRFEVIE